MKAWPGLVLFAVPFLTTPGAAQACDCAYAGAPCKAFGHTPVIFVGRVKKISKISIRAKQGFDYPQTLVAFEVSRAYRGIEGKATTEVMTGGGDADCGYVFRENGSYLVYALPDAQAGRLYTGICTRTRLLSEAVEDLEYLDHKDDTGEGAGIEGWIDELSRDSGNRTDVVGSLKGVPVRISGASGKWTVTTDQQGRFKLWGLKAGTYQITPAFAPKFVAMNQTVTLRPKSCEEIRFLATPPPRK